MSKVFSARHNERLLQSKPITESVLQFVECATCLLL